MSEERNQTPGSTAPNNESAGVAGSHAACLEPNTSTTSCGLDPVDWPTGTEFKASLLTCTGHSVTPKWNQSDVTDNIPDLPPFTK